MFCNEDIQYISSCNWKSDCQIVSGFGFAGSDPCNGTLKYA